VLRDLLRHRIGLRAVDVRHAHPGPALREAQRRGAPDPRSRARHQHHLAVEPHVTSSIRARSSIAADPDHARQEQYRVCGPTAPVRSHRGYDAIASMSPLDPLPLLERYGALILPALVV